MDWLSRKGSQDTEMRDLGEKGGLNKRFQVSHCSEKVRLSPARISEEYTEIPQNCSLTGKVFVQRLQPSFPAGLPECTETVCQAGLCALPPQCHRNLREDTEDQREALIQVP